MKTSEKIKQKARLLFNQQGVRNVTLRDVAKELGISYGNVTYHYKTKEYLLEALYQDMLLDTRQIMSSFNKEDLFVGILEAPALSFEVSMKHLFFYVDYVELRRKYPQLFEQAQKDNELRKKGYFQVLVRLQHQGYIREELTPKDLDYLMDLSGSMRTFFFINLTPQEFEGDGLKERYVNHINQLLVPYLTAKGVSIYINFDK